MKVRNVLQNPRPEPAPDTVFTYHCDRCDFEFQCYGIDFECSACRVASLLVYGRPIGGGVSGC